MQQGSMEHWTHRPARILVGLLIALQLVSSPGAAIADQGHFRDEVVPDRPAFGLRATITEVRPGLRTLVVIEVQPGGPAEEAGLLVGDRIISIDGTPASFENDLQVVLELMSRRAGDSLRLELQQGLSVHEVTIKSVAMAPSTQAELLAWVAKARERIELEDEIYCKPAEVLSSGPNPMADFAASLTSVSEFSVRVTKQPGGRPDISIEPSELVLPNGVEPRHVLDTDSEFEELEEGRTIVVLYEKLGGNRWQMTKSTESD